MALLLTVLLVLLLVTLWFAWRLVSSAHRRAEERPIRVGLVSSDERLVGVVALDSTSQAGSSSIVFHDASVGSRVAVSWAGMEDAYADPIDGVPFVRGESVMPCGCGLAYRAESLDWLVCHFGGRCVECGAPVEAAAECMV